MALHLLRKIQLPERRIVFVIFRLFKNAGKTAIALTVSEINRFLVITTFQVILLF